MSLMDKVKQIKKNINILMIAYRKKETPWYAKMVVAITIAYALSPIDLIPDFIPVLGYLDDAIILPLFILLSIRLIPKEVFAASKKELDDIGMSKDKKKWYYGIPMVVFWFLIIAILIKVLIS